MSWKLWAVFSLGAIIIIAPMQLLEISPPITFITAFITLFGGYILWFYVTSKRLSNILEERCDPLGFIKACEKYKLLSKRNAFQNVCNLNIAVGYISSGKYDESSKILQTIDLNGKNSGIFRSAYHLACFAQYIDTDEMQKASSVYEKYLKDSGKRSLPVNMKYAIEMSILEYNYRLNKNTETAKYYMAQLDYLYNSNKAKLSKRLELGTVFNKACLEQELGNTVGAIKKFEIVAENGNGLKIAEQSRSRLNELLTHGELAVNRPF